MKHFNFLLIMLLLGISSQHLYGVTTETPTDSYFCGFNTEEEFNSWTVINVNNDDLQWYWEGNDLAACYRMSFEQAADDWYISPKISLSGGKQYTLKSKMGIYYNPEHITITMGKGNTVESQNIVLLDTIYTEEYMKTYASIKLPADLEAGEYNFGFHITSPAWSGIYYIYSFQITEFTDGSLEGTVTNSKGEKVEGAEVSLKNDTDYEGMQFTTDAEGKYHFDNLSAGEYQISVTADGHHPLELENVTIQAFNKTDHPILLTAMNLETVTGKVMSEEGTPVKNAFVTIKGELSYETTTDENGIFTIEDVREYDKYQLKIEKDLKVTHTDVFSVTDATIDFSTIVLKTRVVAPANVNAEKISSGMLLSWMMPLKDTEIAYDNGSYEGMTGLTGPTVGENTVMGNVFDFPLVVSGMSWMLTKEGGPHETVDLYVFSLNPDGSLSNNILYSKKGVPNVDYDYGDNYTWCEYYFPETITAPYGCVLALGYNGYLGLALDWESSGEHSCASFDYTKGLSNHSSGNFFIRALGSPLGIPQMAPNKKPYSNNTKSYQTSTLTESDGISCIRKKGIAPNKEYHMTPRKAEAIGQFTYKVWRFNMEDKEDIDYWTELEPNIKDLTYIDRDFKQLEQGVYQYAVQAIYADGQVSDISYSNEIEHQMYTNITIEVETNTAIDFSKGTILTLENIEEPEYVYTKVAEGPNTLFENVRKGIYNLYASQKGFEKAESDELWFTDGNENNDYISLSLIPVKPFNLKTNQAEGTTDITFSWNVEEGIHEDFENMDDFTINPAGELGWTYLDGDQGTTFGIAMCQDSPYPNMYAPMAYMSFNPNATTPNLLEYIQPHSGDKVLIDVSLEEGGQNNDYLFSPELSFESDFVLSFYAMSGFYATSGDEEFMVGYCKESATPENVEWITATPQTVGGLWTEFTYDIPQEAKYITIRCTSNQRFIFVLDDIYIGYKETEFNKMATYEVYLDEEMMAKTNGRSVTFDNLSEGKHIVKVQAVYPMANDEKQYSDFAELMFKIEKANGIEDVQEEQLFSYNSESGIITLSNDIQEVSFYDMQGRLTGIYSTAQVNVSNWNSGLYVMKIKTDNKVSFNKVLIK